MDYAPHELNRIVAILPDEYSEEQKQHVADFCLRLASELVKIRGRMQSKTDPVVPVHNNHGK